MKIKSQVYLIYDTLENKHVYGSFKCSDVFEWYFNSDQKKRYKIKKATICKSSYLLYIKANRKENQTREDWFWTKEYVNAFPSIMVSSMKIPNKNPLGNPEYDSFKGSSN